MDQAEAGFPAPWRSILPRLPAHFGLASLLLDTGAVEEAAAVAARMAAEAAGRPEVLWLQGRLAYGRGDPARVPGGA